MVFSPENSHTTMNCTFCFWLFSTDYSRKSARQRILATKSGNKISNQRATIPATNHINQAIHSFGSSSRRTSSSISSTNPSLLLNSSLQEGIRSHPHYRPYPANMHGLENAFQPVTTISLMSCNCLRLASSKACPNTSLNSCFKQTWFTL